MLKLKIRLEARKEYREYGGKYVNSVIIWEKLPFIAKKLAECPIACEKIVIREKKANKIFHNIQTAQADYTRIVTDCDEELKKINTEIKRREEKISAAEDELTRRNEQIQNFNQNETANTVENIFEIRDKAVNLAKKIQVLEHEKEELYRKIETVESETKKKLDEKYNEIINKYTAFLTRIEAVTVKVKQKILGIQNDAELYTDYFWRLYIKQYIRRKKKEGSKARTVEIPIKTALNTEQFQLKAGLFAEKKEEIQKFNDEYNIDYNIRGDKNAIH